jgi:hypothetical protein
MKYLIPKITIQYRDDSKFHPEILPFVPDKEISIVPEEYTGNSPDGRLADNQKEFLQFERKKFVVNVIFPTEDGQGEQWTVVDAYQFLNSTPDRIFLDTDKFAVYNMYTGLNEIFSDLTNAQNYLKDLLDRFFKEHNFDSYTTVENT